MIISKIGVMVSTFYKYKCGLSLSAFILNASNFQNNPQMKDIH